MSRARSVVVPLALSGLACTEVIRLGRDIRQRSDAKVGNVLACGSRFLVGGVGFRRKVERQKERDVRSGEAVEHFKRLLHACQCKSNSESLLQIERRSEERRVGNESRVRLAAAGTD